MTSKNKHTLVVNASTSHLADVRDFVAERSREYGFDEETISDIRLAVDEACTNIIKHAYQYDEEKRVEIQVGLKDNALWVCLTDTGDTFDPNSYSKPDLYKQMKNRKRGGVGVFLIRELMDEVEYSNEKGYNELRMMRKI